MDNSWRSLYFCDLVSTYIWLDMGIDVGYFPLVETQALFNERCGNFFFSDEFASDLFRHMHRLDPAFEGMLTQVNSSKRAFVYGPQAFADEPNRHAIAALRSAINGEVSLFRSREASTLLILINFVPTALIDRALMGGVKPWRLENAEVNRETITLGFTELVSYMENLAGLSARIKSERELAEEDRAAVDKRIRQATRWRINTKIKGPEERLFRIGKFVAENEAIDWATMESHSKPFTAMGVLCPNEGNVGWWLAILGESLAKDSVAHPNRANG